MWKVGTEPKSNKEQEIVILSTIMKSKHNRKFEPAPKYIVYKRWKELVSFFCYLNHSLLFRFLAEIFHGEPPSTEMAENEIPPNSKEPKRSDSVHNQNKT